MLLMDYPFIIGEDFTDYANQDTWNLMHSYMDKQSKNIIDKYTGDVVQAITRLQS